MRRTQAEGGTSAFCWVDDPSNHLVVTATTRRYFFHHPVVTPFLRGGDASIWERVGPLLFFWQFVKGAHGTANGLERVVLLVTPAISTRSSLPFLLAALPAAFFIACGRPNLIGTPYLF